MSRRLEEEFVLMQIWIDDRKIKELAKKQKTRMLEQFGPTGIPLHAIVSPEGKTLATIGYHPLITEAQYLAFLDKGLAGMKDATKR